MSSKTQKKTAKPGKQKKSTRTYKSSDVANRSGKIKKTQKQKRVNNARTSQVRIEDNKTKRQHREFVGILIIGLSILFGLSIYYKNLTGLFGEVILHIFTGMLGFIAYFLPPVLFIYGILHIFFPNRPQIKNKAVLIFLLLVLVGAIFNAGSFNKSNYVNMSALKYIKAFYQEGRNVTRGSFSGGVICGVISTPLCLVLQKTGTVIVLGTAGAVLALMITELSIKKMIVHTVNQVKNFQSSKAELYDEDELETDEPVFLKELDEPATDFNSRRKSGGKIIDFPLEKAIQDEPSTRGQLSFHQQSRDEFPVNINENKASVKQEKSEELSMKDYRVKPMLGREYHFPPFSCMQAPSDEGTSSRKIKSAALENAKKLEETLLSFGIGAQVIHVGVGPAFTRFELQPSPGIKVSRIVNLADDIALSLAAQGIRIEAPIPGKAAVGIEVPNREVAPILLREVLETPDFVKYKSRLAVGLGKDISGENIIIDLAKMPHLLIAGATGSGKSVCINSIIISLLYKATPEEVKLLMIDPKVVELGVYNGIPHLLIPVVTDASKAAGALQWAVQEMITRYKLFADKGVRDLTGYNNCIEHEGDGFKLPQIVIIIDELADLMMVAPHDVEDSICRLAQMARAAGMHLVIATQRPSVNVITGVIKANIPSRISFAVSSQVDSRTILDMGGAEKLLGKGDMLYFPVGLQKPVRVKGAFISDGEVEQVVEYVKMQATVEYDEDIIDKIAASNGDSEEMDMDADELLPQAIELVVDCGQASVSLIQRRFKVGYARAGRIVDQMAERGIISGFEGSKPRRVLISKEQWEEMKMGSRN